MKNTINERISALREVMRRESLDAFIFPSTDPHNGEYIPEHWESRKWISGFGGSAGTAVVTMNGAALWTDSRYFIAAEEQLAGTEFKLMKLKMPGTPSVSEWLGMVLSSTSSPQVGIDGMVMSRNEVEGLKSELRAEGGITLRTNFDPLKEIWSDRPQVPEDKVFVQPLEYAGISCREKVAIVRKKLEARHADGILITALDDVAWMLNMRGNDVHCNPVFVAYLLLDRKNVSLYINKVKLTPETEKYLEEEGVSVYDYEAIGMGLEKYPEYNILLDPDEVNYTLYNKVKCSVISAPSPVRYLKVVKNDAEIKGFRNAMLKDGIAMVKFLKWVKPAVEAGGQSELTVTEKLYNLRAEQPLFKGISFDTIAGYADNGAIVHYEADETTDRKLEPRGFLLLDSGAQYTDGTTDITRTIPLGELTEEEKKVYTLVLKGHIKIERCVFPEGASGTQLDILAREDMWRAGYSFMHGTGHGVGSYLNVHEGSHQIRMEWKPAPLLEGMTVTDEPGIYLAGKFGVRIENTLLITDKWTNEFGKFLTFESLTLCPIDTRPIVKEMLSKEEIEWLNEYHKRVYDVLSPHLDEEERKWLLAETAAI